MTPTTGVPILLGSMRETASGPVVFLTNRYNLLEILASGAITPRAGYAKYYDDLLGLAPGRVPLVRAPVSESICSVVMGDDADAFPVALEMDTAWMNWLTLGRAAPQGSAPARAPTADAFNPGPIGEGEPVAWAPACVIPLSAVTRLHFRSDAERREHERRQYENVPGSLLPAAVTPSLFVVQGGAAGEADAVARWLGDLPTTELETPREFDRVDRLTGALTMLLAVAPGRRDLFEEVAALLNGDRGEAGTPAAPRKRRPKKEKPNAGKSEGTSRAPALPAWLRALADGGTAPRPDLEHRLFDAALSVLGGITRSAGWRPLEALGAIDARVREVKLSKAEESELTRTVDHIRAILRNERELKPFRTDAGLNVAKALLLVLLRPDPMKLGSWSRGDLAITEMVWLTAAALAGALAGFKRLPMHLRGDALVGYFGERNSDILNRLTFTADDQPGRNALLAPVRVSASGAGDEITLNLGVGDRTLVVRKQAPPSLAEQIAGLDLADETVVTRMTEVCRILGWPECVVTVISLASPDFAARPGRRGALTIEITGWPELSTRLEVERFKTQLDRQGIAQEHMESVRATLRDLLPSDEVSSGQSARESRSPSSAEP